MSETKTEKFERLRDLRLAKVLEAMRILGNITNPRDYEYTPEQAADVVAQIKDAADRLALDFGLDVNSISQTPLAEDIDQDLASERDEDEAPVDSSDPDPKGPKSRIKEHDGAKLKVAPGDWKSIDLLRAGPHLGLAFEAVMDGKNREALDYLKKVMTA